MLDPRVRNLAVTDVAERAALSMTLQGVSTSSLVRLCVQWRPMTTHYYIESDGRIYLVPRDGHLDLPTRDEIPFRIEEIGPLTASRDVVFCVPQLEEHPAEWMSKDAVPTGGNVASLVREAVHASMPRVVSEGVTIENGRLLLLKGARGLTKDRWTLPGGFVRFGEDPETGLLREIDEELGTPSTILELLSVRSKLGAHTRLHWTMFFYHVSLEGDIEPNPDEIAEARFFAPKDGLERLDDPVMRDVIQMLL